MAQGTSVFCFYFSPSHNIVNCIPCLCCSLVRQAIQLQDAEAGQEGRVALAEQSTALLEASRRAQQHFPLLCSWAG